MIWETLDKLEEAGLSPGAIFSVFFTEGYKWTIEQTGSSFTAMKWMGAALQDMAELGPRYEHELHGKRLH